MKLNMVLNNPENCFCVQVTLREYMLFYVTGCDICPADEMIFFFPQGSQDRYLLLLIWNRSSRCHSVPSLMPGYTNESRKRTRNSF